MYALYRGPRLPAAFRGNDDADADSHVLDDAVASWATLSDDTRAAIGPYLLPPAYQHDPSTPPAPLAAATAASPQGLAATTLDRPTWENLCRYQDSAVGWTFYDTAHVRIWWNANADPTLAERAVLLGNEFETHIYPRLTADLGTTPLSDGGGSPGFCRGGDDKPDVYLTNVTKHYSSSDFQVPYDQPSSGFIVLRAGMTCDGHSIGPLYQVQYLAHEFMHLLQFTFPFSANDSARARGASWFAEATAMWAIDRVYPAGYAYGGDSARAVVDYVDPRWIEKPLDAGGDGGYRTWLFPRYLTDENWSNVGILRKIFLSWKTRPSALDAVRTVVDADSHWTGFDDAWAHYAAEYWNYPPVDFFYRFVNITGLEQWVTPSTDITNAGQPEHTVDSVFATGNTSEGLRYLSAAYAHLQFPDPTTKAIRVTSPFTEAAGELQAVVHVAGGEWQKPFPIDGAREFCRDDSAENFDEIVLVASNSDAVGKTTRDLTVPVTVSTACDDARSHAPSASPAATRRRRLRPAPALTDQRSTPTRRCAGPPPAP